MSELLLPWPPSNLSPNARVHWRVKSAAAKAYRETCGWQTKASKIVIDWEGDVHLWITFYPPNKRHFDDDNVASSFKSGRDGIADGLGINDKRFRTYPWLSTDVIKGGQVKVRFSPRPEGSA